MTDSIHEAWKNYYKARHNDNDSKAMKVLAQLHKMSNEAGIQDWAKLHMDEFYYTEEENY